jgi:hypothetical protein
MAITAGTYVILRNSATTSTKNISTAKMQPPFPLKIYHSREINHHCHCKYLFSKTPQPLPLKISHSQKLNHYCHLKYFIFRDPSTTVTVSISLTETQPQRLLKISYSQKLSHNFY